MRVEWHGQSAFTLSGSEAKVFIDPFGDMGPLLADRGLKFDYPPIEADDVDLLLVTHEHRDHNAVEVIGGEPETLRATAGKHDSETVGEVLGVASEHDEVAGTERGANTIFVFELDGLRVAHFGDFGQRTLREEQAAAIGAVDLLLLPVGGGPTIGAAQAGAIVSGLDARWVVPMHYRTARADFLPEAEEDFVAQMPQTARFEASSFDTADLPAEGGPIAVVPAAP
ncbi:MAG TPA: MBL fold metallo-hydrolase [Solirubrobacterales bacterium]|nr:MBL fold metallo-hydrolase [Solirubrobacterales bacterium]